MNIYSNGAKRRKSAGRGTGEALKKRGLSSCGAAGVPSRVPARPRPLPGEGERVKQLPDGSPWGCSEPAEGRARLPGDSPLPKSSFPRIAPSWGSRKPRGGGSRLTAAPSPKKPRARPRCASRGRPRGSAVEGSPEGSVRGGVRCFRVFIFSFWYCLLKLRERGGFLFVCLGGVVFFWYC